jgi:hypothetical protein
LGEIKLMDSLNPFPDPDGNIISYENNNNYFVFDSHNFPIELHKSYIKGYIDINFPNIIKNDLFNKNDFDLYLKYYCRKYFIINPDEPTDVALTNLSIKLKTDFQNELIKLNKYLKLAKQYIYTIILIS